MTLLKEQDWLKIINEAYVHPYGHQLLCNYDWQTRLVVTKIFQVFQSGNYIAYTVLAECPVCKKNVGIDANYCRHCGQKIEY